MNLRLMEAQGLLRPVAFPMRILFFQEASKHSVMRVYTVTSTGTKGGAPVLPTRSRSPRDWG